MWTAHVDRVNGDPVELARSNAVSSTPARNRLLAALPTEDLHRVAGRVALVQCPVGMILVEDGKPADWAYFPTTCIAARFYTMKDGSTSEHGIIGSDGLVGITAFLGGGSLPGRVEVLVGGDALRMTAAAVLDEFRRGGAFQQLLLRYTQELIVQISLEAVCRSYHAAEQRLARLLLLMRDRSSGADLPLTQESIATLLGVRRETVSHAAAHLQSQHCIRYERGHITVVDVTQLKRAACECYRAVADESARLF